MSKAGKIAIGCGMVVMLAVVGICVTIFFGARWAKHKIDDTVKTVTGDSSQIEDYTRRANESPFTPPVDGVVGEDQLKRYLEVRKDIYSVYLKYQDELEKKRAEDVSASDFTRALGAINELRLAQAKGLASARMNEAEYRFVKTAIYQAFLATATQGATGKQMSEVLRDSAKQMDENSRRALEQAGKVKVDGVGQASPEQIRAAQEKMREMMAKAADNAEQLRVPEQNLVLFRRYKPEIDKYAMNGLDLIGL